MKQYYQSCIQACLHCINASSHCASSWLKEPEVKHMAQCIQLDLENVPFVKCCGSYDIRK